MNASKAVKQYRKAFVAVASALIVLGGLAWTLAHAGDAACPVASDLDHDQLLLVLHSNGGDGTMPRLPNVAH